MTSVNSLYFPTSLETIETISPSEFKNNNSIDKIVIEKIRNKIGNKCNSEGFIKKNSIKLIKRSIGKINAAHFTGDVHFNILYEANICIPVIGKKVKARVIGKNQAGIFCVANPLQIMLSPETVENSVEVFNDINKDDQIEIEIINYRVMLNYDHIKILGKFIKKL